MFTQNLSFTKSFLHEKQVHYKVYPWILTNENTNICALRIFGQGVRKEGNKLITNKSKMTEWDKLSLSAIEDDHWLPQYTHCVWLQQDLRKLLRERRVVNFDARLKLLRTKCFDRFAQARKSSHTRPSKWRYRLLIGRPGASMRHPISTLTRSQSRA